jgi:hypothetical protein
MPIKQTIRMYDQPKAEWLSITPGNWKFLIKSLNDEWKVEFIVSISRHDLTGILYVTLTHGKPGWNFAYRNQPAFP